ncbi:MAG: hypothetical protein AAF901_01450 [Bacteroidota bacterium]
MSVNITDKIKYNEAWMVPAITQQHKAGEILMLERINMQLLCQFIASLSCFAYVIAYVQFELGYLLQLVAASVNYIEYY